MKTTGCHVWGGFILLISLHAQAQVSDSLRTSTETNQLTDAQLAGRAAQWRVKQRGAHETEWYTVRYRTNAGTGKVTASTNSYIELATGLNRFEATTAKWVESKEEIEIVPGGAVARKGQHRVTFAANINTAGAIQTTAPDGKVLRSHVLGLAYTDAATGESVLIAGLKDSIGEVIGNQVIYRDAFDGPFKADLRYTYTKAGFEQDVIFRESPVVSESPEKHGMDPAVTRLEVWTEFLSPPAPIRIASNLKVETNALVRSAMVDPDLSDETLDFGGSRIGPGTAFSLDDTADEIEKPVIPVGKNWLRLEGRDFLIEKVDFEDALPSLLKLPAPESLQDDGRKQAALPSKPRSQLLASLRGPSSDEDRAQGNSQPMRTASISAPERGFVLDYIQLNTSQSDYVFKGAATYHVTAAVTLSGTTTIEGGTVVKFNSGSYLTINGPISCRTEAYRPAFFTARDDNSVGETVTGSTGAPNGYYATYIFKIADSTSSYDLHDLRMRHGNQAIQRSGGSVGTPITLRHSQVHDCNRAFGNYYSPITLRNVLVYRTKIGYYSGAINYGENVTFHLLDKLVTYTTQPALQFKNTLLISCTNNAVEGVAYVADPTVFKPATVNDAGIFQTVGLGGHYLAASSPHRGAGTSVMDPGLRNELRQRTTYPPQILTSPVTTSQQLEKVALRDRGVNPDLGYHYDSVDWLADGVQVENGAQLKLGKGVTVGILGQASNIGITARQGASFESVGSPHNPNHFVWSTSIAESLPSVNHTYRYFFQQEGSPGSFDFHFTEFPSSAGQFAQFPDDIFAKIFKYADCRLYGGSLWVSGPVYLDCRNVLFEKTVVGLLGSGVDARLNNCLFIGGQSVVFADDFDCVPGGLPPCDQSIGVFDCVFDAVDLNCGGVSPANGWNAYVNCSGLPGSLGGDQFPSSIAYEKGPLGNYYLPYLNQLRDAGSATSATQAGMYHYTTDFRQFKEGTSRLDIGLHYVAMSQNGFPSDVDTDSIPDFVEDSDGDNIVDAGESNPTEKDTADITPPTITIVQPGTAPSSSGTINLQGKQPVLQVKGYGSERLSEIVYDVAGQTGLSGTILKNEFDVDERAYTATWFQCYDLPITVGNNTITIRAKDMAGNQTVRTINYVLSLTPDNIAPQVTVTWPPNNAQLSGATTTIRGTVSDPTATVRVTGATGGPLDAFVDRDGNFRISDVPISALTQLQIEAVDSQGEVSSAPWTVQQNPLAIVISASGHGPVVVNVSGGTVNAVKVNGVSATSSGSGNWTVPDPFDDDETSAEVVAEVVTPQGSVWASSFVEFPAVIRLTEYSYQKSFDEHYRTTAGGGSVYHDRAVNSFVNWTYDGGGTGVYSDVDHWTTGSGHYGSIETIVHYFWYPKNSGGTMITYTKNFDNAVNNGIPVESLSYGLNPAFPGGMQERDFTKLVENVDDGPIHIDSRRNTVTEDSAVTLYCSPTKYGKHFEVIEVSANRVDFGQNNSPNEMEPSIPTALEFKNLSIAGKKLNGDSKIMIVAQSEKNPLGKATTRSTSTAIKNYSYSPLIAFKANVTLTYSYHPLFAEYDPMFEGRKETQAAFDTASIILKEDWDADEGGPDAGRIMPGDPRIVPGFLNPFFDEYLYRHDSVPTYVKFTIIQAQQREFPPQYAEPQWFNILDLPSAETISLQSFAHIKQTWYLAGKGGLGRPGPLMGFPQPVNAIAAAHEYGHTQYLWHRHDPPPPPLIDPDPVGVGFLANPGTDLKAIMNSFLSDNKELNWWEAPSFQYPQ